MKAVQDYLCSLFKLSNSLNINALAAGGLLIFYHAHTLFHLSDVHMFALVRYHRGASDVDRG